MPHSHKHILNRFLFLAILLSMIMTGLGIAQDAQAIDPVSFLSDPVTEAYVHYKYDYLVVPSNTSANLTLYWTDATWAQLLIVDWHLIGFPNETDYGRVWMSLQLELMDTTFAWQNFTIDVVALDVMLMPDYAELIPLLLALVFCIFLFIVGIKDHSLWLLAGPIWLICGLTIFIQYDVIFMYVGLGLGLVLFLRGAYDVYK